MGSRQEYNNCMVKFMTGGGPERKTRFCIGAKVCSKKASNEQEAAKLCAEAAANPKPAKTSTRRGRSKFDPNGLAECVMGKMDGATLTRVNLSTALASCAGVKAPRKT